MMLWSGDAVCDESVDGSGVGISESRVLPPEPNVLRPIRKSETNDVVERFISGLTQDTDGPRHAIRSTLGQLRSHDGSEPASHGDDLVDVQTVEQIGEVANVGRDPCRWRLLPG